MSFIRLIILFLLIYFAVKLLQILFKTPTRRSEVKGTPRNKKPLDLTNADIEDADFKEINDDEN